MIPMRKFKLVMLMLTFYLKNKEMKMEFTNFPAFLPPQDSPTRVERNELFLVSYAASHCLLISFIYSV